LPAHHQVFSCHTRNAIAADLDAIARIEQVSFVHAGERFGERRVRYLIDSPRVIVRIAELDEKVSGWICGLAVARSPQPWGRIYALAVDPAARGKKIGPQLLGEMIELLRQQGAKSIFLEVRPDNHAAIRLYEKSGFVPWRELEHYYGPGRPALRMVLNQPGSASNRPTPPGVGAI
jgi:ribosomal protein S18 acetylase RimI-like enzyme